MTTVPKHAPTRLVVLSELSAREKDKYYELLLRSETKFYFDAKLNKYVGNVRLLGPNVKRAAYEEKKKEVVSTLPFEERLKRLQEGNTASVRIQGIESFDYEEFVKFVALIASNGEFVKPKQKSLTWLMRMIEDLYDARFAFEKSEIEKDDSNSTIGVSSHTSTVKANAVAMFPVFAIRRMCTLQGLSKIVDQTCWDMLYNIHKYRQQYLEVELFARFLKEHYSYDDLLFFLYVRNVISKTLNINFRGRWNCKTELHASRGTNTTEPPTLFLSHRECVRIANIVFGSEGNEAICRRFIAMVTTQLVGQLNTETQTDSRRIDVTQFLHLAVVGYHFAQNMPADAGASNGGGYADDDNIDHMMQELQDQQPEEASHRDQEPEPYTDPSEEPPYEEELEYQQQNMPYDPRHYNSHYSSSANEYIPSSGRNTDPSSS